MCSITETLVNLIGSHSQFQIVKPATRLAHRDTHTSSNNLVGFINPIHPCYIQIAEQAEIEFIQSLSKHDFENFIEKNFNHQTLFFIFNDQNKIPDVILRQNSVSIALVKNKTQPTYSLLLNLVYNVPIESCSIHSSMAAVYGQGILVTGNSGSGKSSLLLALLEKGHLWVADDSPLIYLNNMHHVLIESPPHLSEYIHIKHIGAINVDQTFGKSRKIPYHRLAAIIHLSDNSDIQNSADDLLLGHAHRTILGIKFPEWRLPKKANNLALLVETITKQLILEKGGNNAAQMLSNEQQLLINKKYEGDKTR